MGKGSHYWGYGESWERCRIFTQVVDPTFVIRRKARRDSKTTLHLQLLNMFETAKAQITVYNSVVLNGWNNGASPQESETLWETYPCQLKAFPRIADDDKWRPEKRVGITGHNLAGGFILEGVLIDQVQDRFLQGLGAG